MNRKPLFQWAKEYVGDPDSHIDRGNLILRFLMENGLRPTHTVLDIGCGALSQGRPIINHLNKGNYVGIEPNGWLIEAALTHWPGLKDRQPEFLYRADFDASELDIQFDYVVAHSVLSHAAHWQLDQMFVNTRKTAHPGTVWLCSFRNDQYNSWSDEWRYPGHTTFRLTTVMAAGYHAGWGVELIPEYQERMIEVCPNDTHDWLRLTAVASAEEQNNLRLAEEEQGAQEREALAIQKIAFTNSLKEIDTERIQQAGLVP